MLTIKQNKPISNSLLKRKVAILENPKDGIINETLTTNINIIVNLTLTFFNSVSTFIFSYSLNISLFNMNLLKKNKKISKGNNINNKIITLSSLERITRANNIYKIIEKGK